MRSVQRGDLALAGDDGGVGGAGGQNHVVKAEFLDEPAGGVFAGGAADVEHVAQQQEFLVVDLEDGGRLEEFLDEVLGVVVATQVDVEELHRARLGVLEQLRDGGVRFGGAQGQGAEADGVGLGDHVDELAGVQDVVPSHALDDGVLRDAVLQRDLDGGGRPGVALDDGVDAGLVGLGNQFVAEFILADRADGPAFGAVLHRVVGEVDGGAAGSLAARQHIPQQFTEAQNDRGGHGWFPFLCFFYRVFRMEHLVMSALGLGDVEEHRGVFEELGHRHCCGTGDRRVGGQGG